MKAFEQKMQCIEVVMKEKKMTYVTYLTTLI
jgi:hypothetical protein